nr:YrbL family protein [Zhongshania aliphaticivorans]
MVYSLSGLSPFAEGGRRQCYIHPEYDERCIKVRRPDRPLEYLRSRRNFPKSIMPLATFDDSRKEYRTMKELDSKLGNFLYKHVNHCYGFEETDLGAGLVCELITDADGQISSSLRNHIEHFGYDNACQAIVDDFSQFWLEVAIPYRGNFRLENLVVQKDRNGEPWRLVVIDDIGYSSSVPAWLLPRRHFMRKAEMKVDVLYQRIQALVSELV